MAAETVTAAEVLPGSDTQYYDGIAGASVTAGQTVYLDASDSRLKLADADASSTAAATKGIAMHAAGTGQPLKVAIAGHIDPGFTVSVGAIYIQSATAGGISPVTDLGSGMYTTVLGLGITASSMKIVNQQAGVAVPA